jgi:Dolichyl-phosphate-mannose-protein mannosyltransferase
LQVKRENRIAAGTMCVSPSLTVEPTSTNLHKAGNSSNGCVGKYLKQIDDQSAVILKNNLTNDRIVERLTWILFSLSVCLVIGIRVRLLGVPLERDEGEYAYAGQLLLQGIPPYKLAYNMKFPGTYAAHALIMAIFGQSAVGIHLGLLLVNLGTVALIYSLGKRLINSIVGGVAAATYALLSLSPSVLGLAAHATHFVVLPAVGGAMLLLIRPDRPQRPWRLFIAGVLSGIAGLMKQPGFYFALFGAVYLFFSDIRGNANVKRAALRNLVFGFGVILPLIITCLVLYFTGAFDQFWFWTIKYAHEYVALVPISAAARIFTSSARDAMGASWPLWALAGVGLLACFVHKRGRENLPFLLGLLLSSALALCSGFYFRPHYFVLVLPVISLLVGVAVGALSGLLQRRVRMLRFVSLLLFACALCALVIGERDVFFYFSPLQVSRLLYWGDAFPECARVADYTRDHSRPGDSIAVLGSEPEIYFYSHRHSATGYIYTYPLMEPQKYAHQMQLQMIREIESARPRYLISVSGNQSWLRRSESEQLIFAWANRYLAENYLAVALVNIMAPDRVGYYFDHVPETVPKLGDYILVYQRKL